MGRKRVSFKRFKAWPILLGLAGIYWIKENMGITDISELNSRSDALLPIFFVVLLVGGLCLGLILLFRPKREDKKEKFSDLN